MGTLAPITVALITYGLIAGQTSEGDESEFLDLSMFKKDRLKLFGVAGVLLIATFFILPYLLF